MTISDTDLANATTAWGEGIISLSQAYEAHGITQAKEVAGALLDRLYGFELGPVLFKPTLSGGVQTFRTDKDGALSYFVGHNPAYPADTGFGIKYWREVHAETAAQFIDGDVAMWMGWVSFINKENELVKVDKSFGYKQTPEGALKIVLHHSSLPFEG